MSLAAGKRKNYYRDERKKKGGRQRGRGDKSGQPAQQMVLLKKGWPWFRMAERSLQPPPNLLGRKKMRLLGKSDTPSPGQEVRSEPNPTAQYSARLEKRRLRMGPVKKGRESQKKKMKHWTLRKRPRGRR